MSPPGRVAASLDLRPVKKEAGHGSVFWVYSGKRAGSGRNPGDWIIPGLASLAWALSPFFLCRIGLSKCFYLQFKTRVSAWELGKVSVHSGFSINQYYDLRKFLLPLYTCFFICEVSRWTKQFLRHCDFFDPYQKAMGDQCDIFYYLCCYMPLRQLHLPVTEWVMSTMS